MQTLIISDYDNGYVQTINVYENGKLLDTNLRIEDDVLSCLNLIATDFKFSPRDAFYYEANLKKAHEIINAFDAVMICCDGRIRLISKCTD